MPIKNLCLLLLAASTAFACKKYVDGPNFSLKSEEARLVRKWQVQIAYHSFFTDTPSQGEDQTYIWQNLKIEFKEDNTYVLENYNIALTEKTIETGNWEFTEDLLRVKTTGTEKRYDVETDDLLSQKSKSNTWRVTRLTKKECWIWYQNQVDPPWIYFKLNSYK